MTAPAFTSGRLLVAVVVVWSLLAASGCRRTPTDDSPEAGFARDMATHHAQAVEMSFLVRDATPDPELRALAADIIVTQSAQRGMFMAWLQLWDLPQATAGSRMAWMPSTTRANDSATAHAHAPHAEAGLPLMAGMASTEEVQRLRVAASRDAEVLFLQLMIRHHEGGVLMAKALLDRSEHDDVVALARGIDSGQTGEIQTMTQMLAARGGQPLPSLLR